MSCCNMKSVRYFRIRISNERKFTHCAPAGIPGVSEMPQLGISLHKGFQNSIPHAANSYCAGVHQSLVFNNTFNGSHYTSGVATIIFSSSHAHEADLERFFLKIFQRKETL
jgi:hypothetical protein